MNKPSSTAGAVAVALIIIGSAAFTTSCQTPEGISTTEPTVREVAYILPSVVPVDATKESQERDGLRITVAARPFAPVSIQEREFQRIPQLLFVQNSRPAYMRETVSYEYQPKSIAFSVRINNQLGHVLRLAGTVLAFQVDGQITPIDISAPAYQQFLNAILLPQQERTFEFPGPSMASLPNKSVVALLLYDVVTQTDQAGTPTKRSTFEFYYTISKESKSVNVPVTVRRINLDDAGHDLLQSRESAPRAWVVVPGLQPRE